MFQALPTPLTSCMTHHFSPRCQLSFRSWNMPGCFPPHSFHCYSLCHEHTFLHLWHPWLLLGIQISAEASPPSKRWPSILPKLLSLCPEPHVTSLHKIILFHFPQGSSHSPNLPCSCVYSLSHQQASTRRMLETLPSCFPLTLQYLEQC